MEDIILKTDRLILRRYCGSDFDSKEIGYVFNKLYWGMGYAKEGCKAIIDYCFSEGVHRIFAECDPENRNSWKMLEALGFDREAHLKQNVYFWKDETGNPIWKETFIYALRNKEAMKEYQYLTLRECPEMKNCAAQWFHEKWGVPTEAYLECMDAYLVGKTELGWYLCLKGDQIIGGMGVIENDFHDRKDLTPNVCAVYTEEAYRGQGIAGRLLNMVVEDLKKKDITPVYLVTDHTGFYEKYGWKFLCMVQGDGEEEMTRMYFHS